NEKTPELFSKMIIKEAEDTDIRITLMEEKELRSKGFGALLAVGQGSSNSSCLMIMHYKPKKSVKKMAVVGKAVTFDSGGINLKPSDHITDMKQDMAGGATTAATIIAVAKLKLNIEMIAAIPMAENMPSGKAIKPGDIIKSYSGKTIEILNTDAEGRLILADTLAYITKTYSPDCILDLATLTGACVVALGEKIAGLYSNNEALSKNILNASTQTSEKCWEMPLPDEYKELMKSDFADIRNISTSRYGGSITAALFLSEFVEKTPWCHLDIAGPAYLSKAEAYCPPGGRGFAVRLLCRLLENYCEA
ncbi:MAG: leucyl aminopeptidase, partial [Verrucomicrobiota bacterium]|nr:leucyl aminopeptidase [Verrucomicrobiota bacterium]